MMNLTDEQKAAVGGWAAEGLSLKEIQSRIQEEFGVSLTYMEARLLVSDLEVSLKDPDRVASPLIDPNRASGDDAGEGMPGGGVRVAVDELVRPGAVLSGRATFSDGNAAMWAIDPMGRLSLEPETPGYRPPEADMMEFQRELQRAVESSGY